MIPSSQSYGQCLVRSRLISNYYDCFVHAYCGRRFGDQSPDRHCCAVGCFTTFSDAAVEESAKLEREASIYCRQVVEDVRWRRRLEREFPGRLHSLTYEQLVRDPFGRANDIYRFIGKSPMLATLMRFSRSAVGDRMKARNRAHRMSKPVEGEIREQKFQMTDQYCAEMIQLYPQYV